MPSTLRRNSSRGLDTCTSPPLPHAFYERAQTPPTSRNACRRRGRSNGDSVRRRSLCRGSSRTSSHASVIRKSNVSRRFETRGERMPQPPWPDESGLYRQPSAAHQPPPVLYGFGCRALATKRQSRWHRDFGQDRVVGPRSQQPFPTVLNHGATQAIATELGRLLLRTGCANLQNRRDARRAARAPPRRPAQASALHRPEGVVFLCLPEPSVDTARVMSAKIACACADRCSAAASCSRCMRAW